MFFIGIFASPLPYVFLLVLWGYAFMLIRPASPAGEDGDLLIPGTGLFTEDVSTGSSGTFYALDFLSRQPDEPGSCIKDCAAPPGDNFIFLYAAGLIPYTDAFQSFPWRSIDFYLFSRPPPGL